MSKTVIFGCIFVAAAFLNDVSCLNASISLSPSSITNLTSEQEETISFVVNISESQHNDVFNVTASTQNWRVFSVVTVNSTISANGGYGELTIRARHIGQSKALFTLIDKKNRSRSVELENTLDIIVLRKSTIHQIIFRIITTALVVIIILLMGCDLDPKIIWQYIKRPLAPAIGFCSQFVLMPLIALGISFALSLPNEFGFGLLTIGCSPGGGGSNMWTVLLGGDLNLSMTMTFLSTVTALGMMPLWLFILGRFYIDVTKVVIPYSMIAINLLQVVLPCLVGMLIRYLKESIAKKLCKGIRPLSLIFVIYIMTYGTYSNLEVYEVMGYYPITIVAGAILPWIGFAFGSGFAFICRQKKAQIIAIGLETGIQNIGIAVLILLYSMPRPLGDLAAVEPIVVAVFTPVPLYIIMIIRTIRRCVKRRRKQTSYEIENEKKGGINFVSDHKVSTDFEIDEIKK